MGKKHGHTSKKGGVYKSTSTYTIWKGMKQRCLNPKNKRFKHYGGRGIKSVRDG